MLVAGGRSRGAGNWLRSVFLYSSVFEGRRRRLGRVCVPQLARQFEAVSLATANNPKPSKPSPFRQAKPIAPELLSRAQRVEPGRELFTVCLNPSLPVYLPRRRPDFRLSTHTLKSRNRLPYSNISPSTTIQHQGLFLFLFLFSFSAPHITKFLICLKYSETSLN